MTGKRIIRQSALNLISRLAALKALHHFIELRTDILANLFAQFTQASAHFARLIFQWINALRVSQILKLLHARTIGTRQAHAADTPVYPAASAIGAGYFFPPVIRISNGE